MPLMNAAEVLALQAALDGTFVALLTSPPDDDGNGMVEVAGGGYARQAWTPTYTAGNPTVASNTDPIEFVATTAWGEVTHAACMTSDALGEVRAIYEFVSPDDDTILQPRSVAPGDTVRFAAGTFRQTLEKKVVDTTEEPV